MKRLSIFLCTVSLLGLSAVAYGQIPIPAGFPTASTTGLAGVGLTVGDLTATSGRTITTDGTTVDMEDVSGTLTVQANNVTIKRCRISNYSWWAIRVYSGYTGVVVEDCLIPGNNTSVGITGGPVTVRRCDISGDHDGLKITGGSLYEDNYIHDQYKDAGSHNDGMQCSAGSNWTVRGNTIQGPYQASTSAIIIKSDQGTISNGTVEDNFLSGGSYTVYSRDGSYGAPTNISFLYNTWEKDGWLYGRLSTDGTQYYEGNVYHTGEYLPENPPLSNQPPSADAGADQSVTDTDDSGSESVTLDGSGSSDSDGTISSYVWEENSTQIATGETPSVSLAVGSHTITLTVTDDDSATDSDSVSVTVAAYTNAAPSADAGADQSVTDTDDSGAESVTLDGSGSSDSDGTISSYVWEENSTQIATGATPSVSLAVGSHTITLTVTDDDSATDSDSVSITVSAYTNAAPSADAGADQTVTDTDDSGAESVTLDGSGSSDSDGTISSYVWEENSTQIATGATPSVSLAVGSHTITLTVTDDDSATDSDTVSVTVNAAPSGGSTYEIDGNASDQVVRSDGTFKWVGQTDGRIGGGVAGADGALVFVFELPTLGTGETVADATLDFVLLAYSHYAPEGNADLYGLSYRSSSSVLTSDFYQGTYGGDTSATAIQDDIMLNTTATGAIATSTGGQTNLASYLAAQYSAGASGGDYVFLRINPDASNVSDYRYWRVATANNATVANRPVLTIITSSSASNAAPVADAGADQTVTDSDGNGSASATLDGTGSSDSDGSIASYVWEEDSSQIATGSSPSVTLDVGVHTIVLTVTDDDSDTDTDSVEVTVVSRTQTSSTSSTVWPASTLPTQTGEFTAEFDVVPAAANIDGVTGLSSGAADWWDELACIVRFNTSGTIDVRDGSAYAADATVSYSASTSYHVRMVVDVLNATYSVYVTPAGGSETTLATDYDFRTEQASITSIDNWTLNATNSVGTHTVSNLTITD